MTEGSEDADVLGVCDAVACGEVVDVAAAVVAVVVGGDD